MTQHQDLAKIVVSLRRLAAPCERTKVTNEEEMLRFIRSWRHYSRRLDELVRSLVVFRAASQISSEASVAGKWIKLLEKRRVHANKSIDYLEREVELSSESKMRFGDYLSILFNPGGTTERERAVASERRKLNSLMNSLSSTYDKLRRDTALLLLETDTTIKHRA